MAIFTSVLNAQVTAATGMFDKATLHTADPSTTGANKDNTAGEKSLTWSSPSNGVSTASASWTGITGSWTHVGLWDGTTFVASIERDFSLPTSANLTVAFRFRVSESA